MQYLWKGQQDQQRSLKSQMEVSSRYGEQSGLALKHSHVKIGHFCFVQDGAPEIICNVGFEFIRNTNPQNTTE